METEVRGTLKTWTIIQHDGPNYLGLRYNAGPCASNGPDRLGFVWPTGGGSEGRCDRSGQVAVELQVTPERQQRLIRKAGFPGAKTVPFCSCCVGLR